MGISVYLHGAERSQAEGIAAAKERGVQFGNPGRPLSEGFEEVAGRWRKKEITLADALCELNIGRTYFFKYVKQLRL